MAGALLITMLAPIAALADTNLVIGGTARIANADGDPVMLRSDPGYDATVLAHLAEGTTVDVLDGPVAAGDGTSWYKVRANGKTGYIVSLFLALDDGSSSDSQPADSSTSGGSAEAPVAAVTGTGVISGTNNDGVLCRTEPSADAAVIMVIAEGATVELTGDQIDIWQPVNCKGHAGYVHAEYVSSGGSAAAPADTSDPAAATETVTGTGEIYNTNGDGIRCRAGAGYDKNVITVLKEGEHVDLRGTSSTDWQPVFCAGRNGFILKDYVKVGGSGETAATTSSSGASFSTAATGTATVSGTNGGGLRCRASASFDGAIITVLAEGTKVSLRGGANGDWQPVTCKSRNGYVHTDFLTYGGTSNTSSPADSTSSGIIITGTATVKTDDGSGLNCRAGAGYNYRVITVLANGAKIDLRGIGHADWQPIVCAGRKAYVLKMYVDFGGGTSSGGSSSSGNTGGSTSGLVAGDWARVSGTNGTGVRFRSGASTNATIISVLSEGTYVKVRSGSTGDWVAVTYNGSAGYIHKDYLAKSSAPPSSGNTNSGNTSSGFRLANGDHAKTTTNLNLRYSPSFSAGVAAVVPTGTVVLITGTPTSGFYPVNWDGLKGYMYTTYLSKTTAALSDRGGSANDGSSGGTSSGNTGNTGSTTGNAIVAYAMQYKGYPYVWATHGPGSFDCSGFTYWVALNVLGINIGAGLFTQVAAGTPVSRSNLRPGDLVFFQNTYTWGLSHVGIYLGNDQFIHAENESTGVTISSLTSQYYASRWYGAVRLG